MVELRKLAHTLPLPSVDSPSRAQAVMNLPDMTDAQMRDIVVHYQDYIQDAGWSPDRPDAGTDVLIGKSFPSVTVPFVTTDMEMDTVITKIWVLESDIPHCVTVRRVVAGGHIDVVMNRNKVLAMCGIGGDPSDARLDVTTFPSVAELLKKSPLSMKVADGRVSAKDAHAVARHAEIAVPPTDATTTAEGWRMAGFAAVATMFALI